MKKIHFHTLDALRFFAFLKVYLLHLPLDGDFPIFRFLKSGGGIGVAFFFVLSGFLITYLLVFQKLQQGTIGVKEFFLRRSLRIWPLFFLIVIFSFALPYDIQDKIGLHIISGGYDPDWRFSFSFMENYKMLIEHKSPKTTPLSVFWSLCIEEHFYLFWVVGMFLVPVRHVVKFCLMCIVLAWGSRGLQSYLFPALQDQTNELFTNLDYFAWGGLLGFYTAYSYEWLVAKINAIPLWVRATTVVVIVLIVIFQGQVLPGNESRFMLLRPTIVAIIFTVLLAVFVPQDSRIRINSSILNYLGGISFGLYVYHLVFIHMALKYCMDHQIRIDNWWVISVYIILTFGGTVLLSMLSYHFFEYPFLKLRDRLTKKKEQKVYAQ